jgi:hypothetical protein
MSIEKVQSNESEKVKRWEEMVEKISHLTDVLGQPMDKNIIEAVVGLNLLEIPTSLSCGGHTETDGINFPYIMGSAPDRPEFRYVGQKEIKDRLMEKYNLSKWGDIFDNNTAEKEYYDLIKDLEETEEYKEWYLKNEPIAQKISDIISEFKEQKGDTSVHLVGIYPGYRIEAHEEELEDSTDREKVIGGVKVAQEEFRFFTEFLRNKFFSN